MLNIHFSHARATKHVRGTSFPRRGWFIVESGGQTQTGIGARAVALGEETRDSTSGAPVHIRAPAPRPPGSRVRHGCPMASCHVVVFLSLARPPPPPSRHMPPLLLPGIHIHGVDENVDLHLVARHAIHEMRVTKTPHASAPLFIVSRKRQNQNPFEGQRGKMEMRDRGALSIKLPWRCVSVIPFGVPVRAFGLASHRQSETTYRERLSIVPRPGALYGVTMLPGSSPKA